MRKDMTDFDKLLNAVDIQTRDYDTKGARRSIYIKASGIKLMFTEDGKLRSVIRGGKSYGPEGVR